MLAYLISLGPGLLVGIIYGLDITPVWDPIRVTHLGPRSSDRATKAGHMTATDQSHRRCYVLARRGPSTYGFPLSRE